MNADDPFGLIGAVLDGKYRIDALLGAGGYGVVYEAMHLVIGERVAIKLLRPLESSRAEELFIREARLLFGLAHPAIVRMYDVGSATTPRGHAAFVVLERLFGATLAQDLGHRRDAGMPGYGLRELHWAFDPILDAVAFAHDRGIIHRDLKPDNVMLPFAGSTGLPKVLDFGIAHVMGGATRGEGAGLTPQYAAPEQWSPALGEVSQATDVFALGAMLFEAATLVPLLGGRAFDECRMLAFEPERRPRLRSLRPDMPVEWEQAIEHATRVDPGHRLASVRELQTRLRASLEPRAGYAVTIPQPTTSHPPQPIAGASQPPAAPALPDPRQTMLSAPPESRTVADLPSYAPRRRPVSGAPTVVDGQSNPPLAGPLPSWTPSGAPPPELRSSRRRGISPAWVAIAGFACLALGLVAFGVYQLVAFVTEARKFAASLPSAMPGAPEVPFPVPVIPPGLPPTEDGPDSGRVRRPRNVRAESVDAPNADTAGLYRTLNSRLHELDACYDEAAGGSTRVTGRVFTAYMVGPAGSLLNGVQCMQNKAGKGTMTPEFAGAFCACAKPVVAQWPTPRVLGVYGMTHAPVTLDLSLGPVP